MRRAGFLPDTQPGAWLRSDGIPVDLMVPDQLAGAGRRSVEIPPHDKLAARKTKGIEATVVDFTVEEIAALDAQDTRRIRVKVAGPAALLIAKIRKITERLGTPNRLNDKDAHDTFRLLSSFSSTDLATRCAFLLDDRLSSETTAAALRSLARNFAPGPDTVGSLMAGRAETGVGDPQQTALATSILADDLLKALRAIGVDIHDTGTS